MTFKHNCSTTNAPTFLDWIKNRGGVSVWKSIDLSDPGFSMSSPALDKDGLSYPKPHWKVENAPSLTVTSADDIEVHLDHEVKRFHVAIRRGAQGLSFKCTDASSRRIRKEVDKAGEGAYYFFDYFTQEAVIMAPEPGKSMALSDWGRTNMPECSSCGASLLGRLAFYRQGKLIGDACCGETTPKEESNG